MAKTLAIIGTAGRNGDASKLTRHSFLRMCEAAKGLWTRLNCDCGVSGGAAWGDHVLVALALNGFIPADRVILHLPAGIERNKFLTNGPRSPGGIANYYHAAFSRAMGEDTIRQIQQIIDMGAKAIVYPGGMIARNAGIAMACNGLDDALLAFTFGNGKEWIIQEYPGATNGTNAGLNPNGTGTIDTWNRAKCKKFHACLGSTHL